MNDILIWNAVAVVALMVPMWLLSLAFRNASIVDIVWGLGFVVIAWVTWLTAEMEHRSLLLPILVTVWGIRLSVYLGWRNIGQPEDFRYAEMRRKHGERFWRVSFYTVYLLQGTIMWVVAMPIQCAAFAKPAPGLMAGCGVALWMLGLFFETVGDLQLARFLRNSDNSGKVMNRGLWRYTRHPNYFGDFCVWWGVFLIAVDLNAPIWSVVGPIVMSIFLLKISGVTLLEKTMDQRRPGYAEYARQTNAFFPGPVRRSGADI